MLVIRLKIYITKGAKKKERLRDDERKMKTKEERTRYKSKKKA